LEDTQFGLLLLGKIIPITLPELLDAFLRAAAFPNDDGQDRGVIQWFLPLHLGVLNRPGDHADSGLAGLIAAANSSLKVFSELVF